MARKSTSQLGVTLSGGKAEFRVWAPFAQSVALIGTFSNWEEVAMTGSNEGVWSVTVKDVEPGHEYKFRIGTGTDMIVRNDPRARQLTNSDNGSSLVVGDTFDWEKDQFTPPPINEQVVYEIHIGTFNRPDAATSGTFSSAMEKLDYLKDLGINMIELMPVASMPSGKGWGYAPSYPFSVESTYGGRHGLLEFVKACHSRGIGVILDVVYNHFYTRNDLWNYDGWDGGGGGIYFYNDERGNTPWDGRRPDYGRAEVRQYILDNAKMWLTEYHIDGLRLDSTIYVRNLSGWNNDPEHDLGDGWTLLADINSLVHKIKPSVTTIAEDVAGNEYITKSTSEGGLGFSAQWELQFPHALRSAIGLTGNLDAINYHLTNTQNGDLFQRILFSDSHDTAANGGTRLNETVTPENSDSVYAREEVVLANTLTLTAPGIPMILQGTEFMQSGSFNDWQMLDWKRAEQFKGIVQAHSHLVQLRRNIAGHTAGLLGRSIAIFHHDASNRLLGYHRWDQGGPGDDVIVIANCGNGLFEDYTITLPVRGLWKVRFNSSWKGYSPEFHEMQEDSFETDEHGQISIKIAPYMALVLSQDA